MAVTIFEKKKKSILDVWLGFVQFSEIIAWTWIKYLLK